MNDIFHLLIHLVALQMLVWLTNEPIEPWESQQKVEFIGLKSTSNPLGVTQYIYWGAWSSN